MVLQNTKGAGVEQRVLQALMAKRFPKIVAQLEKADTSVEVCFCTSSQYFKESSLWRLHLLLLDICQSIRVLLRAE